MCTYFDDDQEMICQSDVLVVSSAVQGEETLFDDVLEGAADGDADLNDADHGGLHYDDVQPQTIPFGGDPDSDADPVGGGVVYLPGDEHDGHAQIGDGEDGVCSLDWVLVVMEEGY